MRVSEAMTRDVRVVRPDQTLREAAAMMAEIDAGALPVRNDDRLIGMITDRDIAVRGVAQGMGPDAIVGECMTSEVKYCFDDEDISDVLDNLGDQQLRRLPVVNRQKRLVGILSLGDLATSGDEAAGPTLARISRHGGMHNQTGDGTSRSW